MMDSEELVFDKATYMLAVRQIWAEYVKYFKSYQAAGIDFEPCPNLREAELLAKMNKT